VLSANGGAGGAGQSGTPVDADDSAGADGSSGTVAAAGGSPEGAGGRGGDGAAAAVAAENGSDGGDNSSYGYGGGGAGAGLGRIAVRGADACAVPGVWSPRPIVECVDCGACPSGPSPDCQPFEHDARMYFRCSAPLDWAEARASCEASGLQLVRIEDQNENDALAAGTAEDTWIGASDVATEGDWRWTDGTAFWSGTSSGDAVSGRYEAWTSGALPQPDNTTPSGMTNADCALIDADGAWADRSCSAAHPYVCEQ
jgi:Lectin C-type domain